MRARKTYGNPGRGLGKGSGQTGTDFGDPEGKWGALTGGAELPRLLEVLGKQEAIGVARRQDHTIGGAKELDPLCQSSGPVNKHSHFIVEPHATDNTGIPSNPEAR